MDKNALERQFTLVAAMVNDARDALAECFQYDEGDRSEHLITNLGNIQELILIAEDKLQAAINNTPLAFVPNPRKIKRYLTDED